MHMPVLEVRLSMITSQYLGETSKNIDKIFDLAKKLAAIDPLHRRVRLRCKEPGHGRSRGNEAGGQRALEKYRSDQPDTKRRSPRRCH